MARSVPGRRLGSAVDMPRFLLSPRWLAGHTLVVVVVGTCIGLGLWQLDRLEQRRTFNETVTAGLEQPEAPLGEVVPPGASVDPAAVAYRRVEAEGTYDPERELLLYGRSLDGAPGHHLLTPLVTADGSAVLVDRGWVPFELDRPPIAEAEPPTGPVRVRGVLVPPEEGAEEPGPEADPRIVRRADVQAIAGRLPYAVAPAYLLLQEQDPAQGASLPRPAPLPELTKGPHLSYAVQWFTFGTIGLIGYVVLLRRELRERAAPAEAAPR